MVNIKDETLSSCDLHFCAKSKDQKGEQDNLLMTNVIDEIKQVDVVEYDSQWGGIINFDSVIREHPLKSER